MSDTGERRLMMPPIYSFAFPNDPERRKWGWHRGTELFEAINNTLAAAGRKPMTTQEIENEFSHLSPVGKKSLGIAVVEIPYISVHDGRTWLTLSSEWLGFAVRGNSYLPAKVGVAIINAIKHPVRNRIKRLLVD